MNAKYRAWDDTLLKYLPSLTLEQIAKGNFSNTNWYQLKLEEWTGKYDKNKTEIYQGDKVKFKNPIEPISEDYIVGYLFWDDHFLSYSIELDVQVDYYNCLPLWDCMSDIEVIGHIHQRTGTK